MQTLGQCGSEAVQTRRLVLDYRIFFSILMYSTKLSVSATIFTHTLFDDVGNLFVTHGH